MSWVRDVIMLVAVALATLMPAHADDRLDATALGWNRAELFAALSSLAGASPVELVTPETLAKNVNAEETLANQTKRLDPGDHVWFTHTDTVSIAVAGTDEHIHTINIYAPVVNYSPEQGEAFKTLNADLFGRLFPDWPEGKTWLTDSLGRTWQTISRNWGNRDPKVMETFVEHTVHGPVALSTTGVPPDIQIYRLTVRPACEIDIKQSDLFQRWVC